MNTIKINGIYRHFKGDYYLLVGTANHSETGETYAVYRKLYEDCGLWIRPLDMFLENVIAEGKEVPRFRYVGMEKPEGY